ncbi:MAG: hypothetical protein Q7K57_53500 [Burkholderiaceae bacterium]|nr:hypothetical protein [Burkholderiaceae bacterium]
MKFVYLLPFTYFYDTRLRTGSVAFHVVFEWLAAVVLALAVGAAGPAQALTAAGLSYLAFISLYEIGYLVNDLFASRKEAGGRQRGPQGAGGVWVAAWFVSRLGAFLFATVLMGKLAAPQWWSYFAALCVVFALHNELTDREFKAATFIWLAWFRFMAPVMFVVQDTQRLGVGLAAAMAYSSFRLFGYLDSKGLLKMPGRQRPGFRLFFFLMPLAGSLALLPYDEARGFVVLTGYYALAAVLGTVPGAVRHRSKNK